MFTRALGACLPLGGGQLQGISIEPRPILPGAWLKKMALLMAGLSVGSVLYILECFNLWPVVPVHMETQVSLLSCFAASRKQSLSGQHPG